MDIIDPAVIVEKFNEFFVNIGPNLAADIPLSNKSVKDFLPPSTINSMVILDTDKHDILSIIKSLKTNSSVGLDNIPIKIIKFAADFIAPHLAQIINCTLTTSIFPTTLKAAKVIPIYKSGDSTQLTNYRPISVLNAFSKIFEKVISSRLLKYLDNSNFFIHINLVFEKTVPLVRPLYHFQNTSLMHLIMVTFLCQSLSISAKHSTLLIIKYL